MRGIYVQLASSFQWGMYMAGAFPGVQLTALLAALSELSGWSEVRAGRLAYWVAYWVAYWE